MVKIRWLGHACYEISSGDFTLITDPYEDESVPGLAALRLRADAVYCSHGHHDHNYTAAVSLSGRAAPADFSVEEFSSAHDDCGGEKRGMNTVRIFRFGDTRVAHLGDLGEYPSAEILAALRGADALLIPIGGFYTIDSATAKRIVAETAPRCVLPMHYRSARFGFDVLQELADFTDAPVRAESEVTLPAEGILALTPAMVI